MVKAYLSGLQRHFNFYQVGIINDNILNLSPLTLQQEKVTISNHYNLTRSLCEKHVPIWKSNPGLGSVPS